MWCQIKRMASMVGTAAQVMKAAPMPMTIELEVIAMIATVPSDDVSSTSLGDGTNSNK